MKTTFQCELCGGTFELGRSYEDAMAESRELFATCPKEDLAEVCDDCFKLFSPQWTRAQETTHESRGNSGTAARP